MNIELYIANRLCDLEKSDLSIKLKRQFINPSELNTKDAQKSYTITLPSTPGNDQIFGYKNVEETYGKFTIYPDARLYVNGILILDGKFRLSEITRDSYKGNLGVPALLTAKDVFGEMKMNEAGSWEIPFEGKNSISKYNNDVSMGGVLSPAFFPLALYGLLPKFNKEGGVSHKELYDSQVRLDLDDFPPSVNCLQMLKKIFENAKYKLTGNAFDDERLKNLYVSYKNPNEYAMDWGANDSFSIKGATWGIGGPTKYETDRNGEQKREEERDREICATNLFDANNFRFNGKNSITHDWVKESKNGFKIVIPASGLYKIAIKMDCYFLEWEAQEGNFKARTGNLNDKFYTSEIYLARNRTKSLDELSLNNKYARRSIDQRYSDNPRIFPEDNNVHFVDPYQDPSLLCGFTFGKTNIHEEEEEEEGGETSPTRSQGIKFGIFDNPRSISKCNPIAISGARSWNYPQTKFQAFSAVPSKAYYNSRGKFNIDMTGVVAKTERVQNSTVHAKGEINQIVWLEKGDTIEMLEVSALRYHSKNSLYEVNNHWISFDLDIIPFRKDKEWLQIDINGTGTGIMNWHDQPNIRSGAINLISFLPSEVTINDWVDNFCKAFNLRLNNTNDKYFDLHVKETKLNRSTSKTIDLDQKTNVVQGVNEPLNLPRIFEFGFAADNKEDGYIKYLKENNMVDLEGNPILSQGYNGGGKFYTNSLNTNVSKQSSNFAYGWFRKLYKDVNKTTLLGEFPSIAEHEIWENSYDYEEMMSKTFFNKAQRFWYPNGSVNLELFPGNKQDIALVSNTYKGNKQLTLDYDDKPNSIMRNYFMLLTNQQEYTTVECYLTPEEYNDLERAHIKFNGDLYITTEADGYDPLGKNKTKLKLIKKV